MADANTSGSDHREPYPCGRDCSPKPRPEDEKGRTGSRNASRCLDSVRNLAILHCCFASSVWDFTTPCLCDGSDLVLAGISNQRSPVRSHARRVRSENRVSRESTRSSFMYCGTRSISTVCRGRGPCGGRDGSGKFLGWSCGTPLLYDAGRRTVGSLL